MSTRPRASAIREWADLLSVLIRSSDLQRAWLAASSQPDARRAATRAHRCRGAPGEATHQAPASLAGAVQSELREAVRPPYTVPLVVTFNGLLMAAAWFLLPTKWFDWLFTLHGPLAFAMVMAGWMYSDVPATNVLAPDRERVLAALDDPASAQPTPLRPEPHPVVLRRAVLHRRRGDHRLFQQRLAADPGQHHRHRHRPVRRARDCRVGRHHLALSPSRPALQMAAPPRVAPHDPAMAGPAPRPLRTRASAGER